MPVLANEVRPSPSGWHARRLQPAVAPEVVEQTLACIPLRDYQKDAVRVYLTGIADRSTVKVVELPAGTGKTRVGVVAAACPMTAGYTVLWACKSRRQLRPKWEKVLPHRVGRWARAGWYD